MSAALGAVDEHGVRKYRAPKGALRLVRGRRFCVRRLLVRKHRAPKGALRLLSPFARKPTVEQKVRKHRAPKGALRLSSCRRGDNVRRWVRKHRAPKGALRRPELVYASFSPTLARERRAQPNFACNSPSSNFNERQKPRNYNDAASNLEEAEVELHATFYNNPPK